MRFIAPVVLSLAAVTCAGAASLDSRSFKAEIYFRLANPSPSTGETRGACTGYVIDRIVPVACGGAEEPANMQWQTIQQAKEKDRWERIGCRPGRKLVMPGPPGYAEAFPMETPEAPSEVAPLR
jgi:hypothetical protein